MNRDQKRLLRKQQLEPLYRERALVFIKRWSFRFRQRSKL